MGRKCCNQNYSCSPCFNPCFNPCYPPPFFGPCCPPPCIPKFYDNDDSCSKKSYFTAQSSNVIDISGQASPYTVLFEEQQDCLCEYINNSTFIPKKKGYYKFTVNVTAALDTSMNQTVTVNLMVNNIAKGTVTKNFVNLDPFTFSISQNLCLNSCDNVYVTISPTFNVQLVGIRTFTGSTNGSCSSSYSSCSSSCSSCSSSCSSCSH